MKIQRLERCEYERYRFRPAFDLSAAVEGNALVSTAYDRRMFREMVAAYREDPNHFGVKMRFAAAHPELQELYAWMKSKTPGLDSGTFEYKFRHRLVWIVNGLTDFPRCPVCGKKIGFEDNLACWQTTVKHKKTNAWNYKTHCRKLHAEMDPEHQKLVEAGVMESLGATHPMKIPDIQKKTFEKGKATYRARTGYDTHFENPEYQKENIERIRRNWKDPKKHKTMASKARMTRDAKSPDEKADIERRRQNSRLKTVGSPNYHWGTRYYEYEGMTFDSSWEIYTWIWFKETGHDIRRGDVRFEYRFDGVVHGYYPDFVIDGELVEVKGDQFFSVRGDVNSPMWHPYFRDRKTPEELARLDGLARAKQRCMRRHGVKILVWKDIAPMKAYADGKYGRDCVGKFLRKTKPRNAV